MSQSKTPDEDDIEEVLDEIESIFDKEKAAKAEGREPVIIWDSESDGECYMLETTDKGSWYPRPTVAPTKRVAEIILRNNRGDTDVDLTAFETPDGLVPDDTKP